MTSRKTGLACFSARMEGAAFSSVPNGFTSGRNRGSTQFSRPENFKTQRATIDRHAGWCVVHVLGGGGNKKTIFLGGSSGSACSTRSAIEVWACLRPQGLSV